MPIVHNKGLYVRHAAGVMLVPGVNNLKDADWKKFSANPLMKKLIADKEIEGHEKAQSTKDMNVTEAVKLVQDTFSPELLLEWAEADERKGVQEAILAQLDELQGKNSKDED